MSDFFVEFEVHDSSRFGQLQNAFAAIRNAKEAGGKPACEDPYWLTFFDDDARRYFWWPSPDELAEWTRRWQSTPVEKRFTDPSLQAPWDFASMIDAFFNGEYELLTCEMTTVSQARLTFDPFAWPYGGVGCMRALVEAFGFTITSRNE